MRGKRSLENDVNDDDDKEKQQPERKCPALARYNYQILSISFVFVSCSCSMLIAVVYCFPLVFRLGFNSELYYLFFLIFELFKED